MVARSRSSMRSRWLGGGLLLAVLAVAASACSSSPSASTGTRLNPHQVVLSSVNATEAASSAAIGISVSVSGTPSLGGLGSSASGASGTAVNVSVTGHGLYSFAQKTGEMNLTIPSSASGGSTATVQIRIIGSDLYLNEPQLSALDGGKPWVHVDLSQFEQQESENDGGIGALSDGDPSQILGLLQQLGTSVTEVGTADIDGVPTTEYQGQIDLTKTSTGSTIISSQMAQSLGLTNIPVDVWVDSAGRARQVSTSFTVLGLDVKAQVNLGSFGTPVSVSAPPADQTADGSSLLQTGKLSNLL
jgi:hypothetical protein